MTLHTYAGSLITSFSLPKQHNSFQQNPLHNQWLLHCIHTHSTGIKNCKILSLSALTTSYLRCCMYICIIPSHNSPISTTHSLPHVQEITRYGWIPWVVRWFLPLTVKQFPLFPSENLKLFTYHITRFFIRIPRIGPRVNLFQHSKQTLCSVTQLTFVRNSNNFVVNNSVRKSAIILFRKLTAKFI